MVSICEVFYWGMKMATFGATMIDEEERPVDSGVIPKTYTTVRVNQNHLLYILVYILHVAFVCVGSSSEKICHGALYCGYFSA